LVVRDSGNGELIMRYGPSLHKNLNGFQEHDGQWRLGDNINDIDYQKALDVDFSLHGDEEFLIVASDGLWDIFKGPRRDEIGDGMTLADQVKAIDNVATMEISVRGLEDRWRRRASVPPLTLANLNEIIVEAIAGGLNPAQALVERTKKLDSDHDDITVVVVDLRNWASRRARVASDAVSAASDKADNLSNYVEDLGLSVPVLPTNVHDLVDQFNTFVVRVDTLSLDEATKESVFGELSDKFKKDFLIFIRHGASIDSLNDKGRTPLVQAMHDKNVMGVRDLLALGASILVKNSQEEVIAAPEIRACDDDMFGVLTEFGRLSAERDQVRRIRESPVVAAASAGVAARPVTAIGSDRNFDVGFAPSLEDDFQQIVLRDFLPNYRPDVTVVGQFTAVPEILTHAGVENNQALRVETAVGDWYVGHLPGYYGIGTKKPDQDAAFVAGLSAGVFDGSGENPMSAAFPESGVARNYATGGANVAKYLMEKARVTGSLEQAAAAYRGLAGKEDLIYQARATDQLVNIAVSGGGCMMCSVTINEHGTSCRVQNDGDAGMIIITEEGRLIHGPSMHANLEGCLGATKCSLGVDGDGSIGKLEDSRVAIPDNAAYLIVACDGLWDRFYGPRSALPGPASVARDDQRAVDSVNVGRSYAPDEISSLRGSESADGLLTTSSILEALRNAEREGKNPAQALVDLSRAKAMERDVQHDDDTTALVFKFKPRAATSGDVDAEGVTVSATRAAGGPAAASYDFDTDLARFCKVLCMASGGVPDEPSLTLETGSLFSGYDYNDLVLDSDAVAWQHENYVYVKNRGKTYFISPGLRDGKLVLREMAIKSPEGRSYPLRDIMREFIANSAPFKKEFSKMRLEKVVQNLEATRQKCTADMSQCKASFVAYNFDETNEFKELPPFVGVGEMGGVRILIGESMEDAVAVRRVGRTMFCGVFDGHGDWDGLFARHCSRALVPCVASSIEAAVSGGIAEAIRRSIVEFDEAQTSFKDLSYAMRHILYNRGTTMSGFFLDSLGKKLYVTNLGDSRTILINEAGALLYATEDHDPNAAREQVRIKAAGGTIIKSTSGSGEYRLMPGNLSVSRAFGDYPEKQVGPRLNSMGESIDIKAPLVSNEADVAEHPAEGVAYAIVACDGLWDVLSNEEAANIVLRLIRKYKDGAEISDGLMLGKVAEDLILIAKGLGSSDNISAVVVDVQAAVAVAHSEAAAIAASARG
ncbi:MAG: protein phosphatase, partial [Candidatus Dependentiae bacterium]|nr:protein phosphatase [Candidatus Dependentiae bacterium]